MRAEFAGGEITACRCSVDAEAVPWFGRRPSLVNGTELGRADGFDVPFAVGWISPTAAETLLVKEEIAQPVQDAASLGCGVLIRGAVALDASILGGGNTVSAIEEANLRTRCRYTSMVLLA